MAEMENEAVSESARGGKGEGVGGEAVYRIDRFDKRRKFSFLVLLASILSAGSLIWTTYSLLDFFQDGGIDPSTFEWKNVNLIGLSAAATADVAWTVTMFAEYRGVSIPVRTRRSKGSEVNILPVVGWAEVLFVAALLFAHGRSVGGGEAAFAAVLPILTRFSWMVALADLKDPSDLTEEQKRTIAEMRRESRLLRAEMAATAEKHQADLEKRRRENEASLEDRRLQNEMKLLDQETDFKLKEMLLRQENKIKALEISLRADLRMSELDARMRVEARREEHDFELSLRRPRSSRTIPGQVVPQRNLARPFSVPEIESGTEQDLDAEPGFPDLAEYGLSESQRKKALLARDYYIADAEHGGVTKAAFARVNGVHPPRLTEATQEFPVEWFVERGLATWLSPKG